MTDQKLTEKVDPYCARGPTAPPDRWARWAAGANISVNLGQAKTYSVGRHDQKLMNENLTEMLTPIAHMSQHTHQVWPWGHECATGQRFGQLYLEQLLVTRTNRKLTETLTLPQLWLHSPT